mgnify:CR=1 FL=1
MNQHEITERRPLLDASGNLTEPGYAKSLLPVYRRSDIQAPAAHQGMGLLLHQQRPLRPGPDHCGQQLHGARLHLPAQPRRGVGDHESPMKAFTNGRVGLPESSEQGDVHSAGRNYSILFKNEGDRRVLIAQMKNFGPEGSLYAKVTLTDIPAESMVIATPFDKDKHFYYNQKINCMRAEGTVTYGTTTARTPLTRRTASPCSIGAAACGRIKTRGTGAALRSRGRGAVRLQHRLRLWQHARREREHALLQGPGAQAQPGHLPHPRRRRQGHAGLHAAVDLHERRRPLRDGLHPRARPRELLGRGLIKSDQHQVFGVFNGRAVLDDGTVLDVKDLPGFARRSSTNGDLI